MKKEKIFISYHRVDKKYKNKIVDILKENQYKFTCVDENKNYNGWKHQHIADDICKKMDDCDILLCIVGKETYTRPHVDVEIHSALKGGVDKRKGIIAVMLENRQDNKNSIDFDSFPIKLKDNLKYIVLEQFASIRNQIVSAVEEAIENRDNEKLNVTHKNKVMQLRSGKYYDN